MLSKYLVSDELKAALSILFGDPEEGMRMLGAAEGVFPPSWQEKPLDRSIDPAKRARQLLARLEGYLVQMANEREELDSPGESERLRSEAVGLVLALREIWHHFPEGFDTRP